MTEIHVTRRGVGGYRVDVYRDNGDHRYYYIRGDGYAIEALMRYIGMRRYALSYAYNSIYCPVYTIYERWI